MAVPDHRLVGVGRSAGADPVPVCVVNTTGAGGLLGLAERARPEVRVLAVESPLRDLDDLAGNAARVVAAADVLDRESVDVYVERPYAPGWERAVEVVEAAGLHAALRLGQQSESGAASLAAQLSVLIEADVPSRRWLRPARCSGC